MSDRTDGHRDMALSLLDRHIERLLAGQTPDDPGLASLTGFFDEMRSFRDAKPSGEAVVARAAAIAREHSMVRSSRAGAPKRHTRRSPSRRPLTVALAGALIFGMASVAVAADGAAPGDLLYPIDRVLEQLGISDGGLDERLTEVGRLISREQADEAMVHLAQSLDEADTATIEQLASRIDHHLDLAVSAGGPLTAGGNEMVDEIRASIAAIGGDVGANQGQGQGGQGQGNQGQDNPGQGQGNRGQDNPGQGQGQGQDNPGQGQGPGQGNPGQGQDNPGQGQGQGQGNPGQGQDNPGHGQDNPGQGQGQGQGNSSQGGG